MHGKTNEQCQLHGEKYDHIHFENTVSAQQKGKFVQAGHAPIGGANRFLSGLGTRYLLSTDKIKLATKIAPPSCSPELECLVLVRPVWSREDVDFSGDRLPTHVTDFEGFGALRARRMSTQKHHSPNILQANGAVVRVFHLLHFALQVTNRCPRRLVFRRTNFYSICNRHSCLLEITRVVSTNEVARFKSNSAQMRYSSSFSFRTPKRRRALHFQRGDGQAKFLRAFTNK